jgi:hypothetical protein
MSVLRGWKGWKFLLPTAEKNVAHTKMSNPEAYIRFWTKFFLWL